MSLSSWGNFPKNQGTVHPFVETDDLRRTIEDCPDVIPYGNGRSYGDSALSENIVDMRPHDRFLSFDDTGGVLHVQSGVLLADILDVFVPRGWFLTISPGTRLITIGGAIASDIHGKNHHVDGCFSECVIEIRMMLANGEIVRCSTRENGELFKATCGGMGLTGIILDAKISLQRIRSSSITQTTIKTKNLRETFDAFEKCKNERYSAAWIDCLAKGSGLGRSLLTSGDFDDSDRLDYQSNTMLNVPVHLPSMFLNTVSVRCFNSLYYARVRKSISVSTVRLNSFFYPLDSIKNWNRIYGHAGFTQYQFVLPMETSYAGLEEVLNAVSRSGQGSFLAVLKLCGEANDNFLSFPMKGYSLALDFKIKKGVIDLLDSLDKIVLKHRGRIYLAKDARVSKAVFEQGYPGIEDFRAIRREYGMLEKFNSMQSRRVGI